MQLRITQSRRYDNEAVNNNVARLWHALPVKESILEMIYSGIRY